MHKLKHTALPLLIALVCSLYFIPASALEVTVDPTTTFCFSSDDFTTHELDDGVFLTAVPSSNIATVRYGDRILKAGDALTVDALDDLTLESACVTQQTASVEYCTIADGKINSTKSLKIAIHPKKNAPPTAESGTFETYKNIANTGTLIATDPEGSALTFSLVDLPKRGTVELHGDGSFTYTPEENKVGNDSFTFTATDDAGNISETAKISIKIKKPTDKTTYADMTDDPDQFKAMWMKDENIFTGNQIAGKLCFSPEKTVSRGEFVVMIMELLGTNEPTSEVSAGFTDMSEMPQWMQPYITAALSNGMISGSVSDEGLYFRPADAMTKVEATVMVQNILELPVPDASAVFSTNEADTIPVWAQQAHSALTNAGFQLNIQQEDEPMSRRDAANILYQIHCILQTSDENTPYYLQ